MKNYLKSLVLLTIVLLSGGFTPTQQTVLFGSGCPTIEGACPSINLDFKSNKYWVNGVGYVPLTSVVSTVRASSALSQDTNGTWYSFSANTLRITNNGALIEEARTNKSTNYNANPTDLTNVTKSGDAASVLSVVDDTAALLAAGLQNIATSGKVYKLDNSAGVASAYAVFSGATVNTNTHYVSVYWRGTGTGDIETTAGGTVDVFAVPATYARKSKNAGTLTGSAVLQVKAYAGAVVYFILNQLEEGSFVTSPIVIAGASATRAADVPQLIGPALTAALNAKAAFLQTSNLAGGTQPVGLAYDLGTVPRLTYGTTNTVVTIDAANLATATLGSGTVAGVVKYAAGFDLTSFTAVANGGTKVTSANPFTISANSPVYLGNRSAGTRALNGYMQLFALSPIKGVFDGATRP